MKITIEVLPGSDHLKAIGVLMQRASFKEIGRVVTGGTMSPVMLVLTFDGTENSFDLLKNSIYTTTPQPGMIVKKLFYSLTCLQGHSCETEEEFLDFLVNQIINKPEIQYFNR